MYKLLKSLMLFSLGLSLVLTTASLAQPAPKIVNYQGRLTDAGGTPVANGSYTVVFTIYDAASGGNSKWTETRSVTTSGGLFAVLLGSVNPIEDTVFNGPTRYLGIKVGTDPEFTPRAMLATVPYAMRVASIDSAYGGKVVEKSSGATWAELGVPDHAVTGVREGFGIEGSLATTDAGVYGNNGGNEGKLGTPDEAVYGIHSSFLTAGAIGTADAGVYAQSTTKIGVESFSTSGMGVSSGTLSGIGVSGYASEGIAGKFENNGIGLSSSTIYATNNNADGIVSWFENTSSDATLVLTNHDASSPILKCFGPGGILPLAVNTNGRVGINTSSPSQALAVSGNICYSGSIGACSDARYKKNVTGLSGSLDNILKMRGITFRWKQDEFPEQEFDEMRHLGFIAQEVEELYPELVMTDDNGYKSVDYSRLTPVLVEAIKEQQEQIDELREMVNQLVGERSQAQVGQK